MGLCTADEVVQLIGGTVADLIPEETLRNLLGGTTDNPGWIERFSSYLETACEQAFSLREETFLLSGRGTNRLFLPPHVRPIVSLQLTYIGANGEEEPLTEGSYTWEDCGVIRLRSTTPATYSGRLDLPRFPVGVHNIRATVTYGYETPPEDVRQACIYLCAIEALGRYRQLADRGLKSRRLGDRSEEYGSEGRFAEEIQRWQNFVDDVIARWRGGATIPAASRRS